MIAESVETDQTWRWLWCHAAYQVVAALHATTGAELVFAGYGWGLRSIDDPTLAILIHPTGDGREIGDLSLTVRGVGMQVIPRANCDYLHYLAAVADVAETVTDVYFTPVE